MKYGKIFSWLYCSSVIFVGYLNCAQEEKQSLEHFFNQRVVAQLANDCNVSCDQLSTVIPVDIQQNICLYYGKDLPRWCKSVELSERCSINDICLSPKEDKIALALDNRRAMVCRTSDLLYLDYVDHSKLTGPALSSQLYCLPDSSAELLLCSSNKGDVVLRNVSNVTHVTNLVEIKHGQLTNAIALDIQSKKIVTGSDDNNACIWDCKRENGAFLFDPHLLLTLPHGGTVWKAVISNDSTKLATACLDGYARVFDFNTGNLLCSVQHQGQVCFVHITKDNQRLISAGNDGAVQVTDIATEKNLATLHIEGKIYTLSVSNDDRVVAAGSSKGFVKVWDIAHDNALLFEKQYTSPVVNGIPTINCVSLNANCSLLAVAEDDCMMNTKATIFDIATGNQLYEVPHKIGVSYAILNRSGSMLVTTSNDGQIIISRQYTAEQTYLRKLLFLWLLVKRIPSNISLPYVLIDIESSLNLISKLCTIWNSFDEQEQKAIWLKCMHIKQQRECVTIMQQKENQQ